MWPVIKMCLSCCGFRVSENPRHCWGHATYVCWPFESKHASETKCRWQPQAVTVTVAASQNRQQHHHHTVIPTSVIIVIMTTFTHREHENCGHKKIVGLLAVEFGLFGLSFLFWPFFF